MSAESESRAQADELDTVLSTRDLLHRLRAPDHESENRAVVTLAAHMANSPQDILQQLVETAMQLCHGGSAGISIMEEDAGEQVFRWHALIGALAPYKWGTTPRNFSPCGTVVDTGVLQLMSLPERHFKYFAEVKPRIVEALLAPFAVEGKVIGTVWVVTHGPERAFDAEDARVLENLSTFAASAYQVVASRDAVRLADRRKDEFLALLAHELRDPLSAMAGVSEFIQLRSRALEEPQIQRMNELGQRQIRSMTRMINDLMDVARIGLDKIELDRRPLPVAALIRQAVDICLAAIDGLQQKLTVSVPEEPLWLDADLARLTQVISNLLSNASKFTPAQGHIEISAQAAGSEVLIRIRDDGIGIPAGIQARIFEKFAQADTSQRRRHGGLGIGLSLVSRLVQLHGGTVAVHSAGEGAGSEFTVRLPLAARQGELSTRQEEPAGRQQEVSTQREEAAARQEKTTAPPAADQNGATAGRSLRILVVDDNADAADTLAMLLQSEGHLVRTSYDAAASLEVARTFEPQVTFQDLAMPGMSGFEVAARMRQGPDARRVTLIALSGYGQPEDRQSSQAAGFDHHLVKPVDFDQLRRLLETVEVRES